jgi:hypothetical protein
LCFYERSVYVGIGFIEANVKVIVRVALSKTMLSPDLIPPG